MTDQREVGAGRRPELSVVLLCYQAGTLTFAVVNAIRRLLAGEGIDYELVLVGNYLPGDVDDPTPVYLRQIAADEPRAVVVAREKAGMMGWDMRSGLEAASGENILVIDGDGQMPVEDIVRVYRTLREGGYDMVKTYRVRRGDGLVRWAVSAGFNALFGLLFPGVRRYRDINGKPKVFTRAAYERLRLESGGWFVDAEIMLQAVEQGFRIGEVPAVFLKNERRRSFVGVGAAWELWWEMVAYRVRRRRRGARAEREPGGR
ncbi:MAG: glycosyltransferase family 2 protein [Kiritimatiellae bacterium]|nr:glycosyltransferase family 2 protein [Kiritimatiellia bacterium]